MSIFVEHPASCLALNHLDLADVTSGFLLVGTVLLDTASLRIPGTHSILSTGSGIRVVGGSLELGIPDSQVPLEHVEGGFS